MTERRLSLGAWLRRRRKALDLTQAELAARAGCALTTVKKIETGARQPSLQLAERLADAVGLHGDERAIVLAAVGSPSSTLPVSPQAQRSAAATPAPAPLALTHGPLIGRARDFAALGVLLRDSDTRLVTLAGPGGVGKTRLALHAGRSFAIAVIDVCRFEGGKIVERWGVPDRFHQLAQLGLLPHPATAERR